MELKNGERYEGQCSGGVQHGYGTWYLKNGKKAYEGDWVNGKRQGKGVRY